MYHVPFSKKTALYYLGLIVSFLAMTLVTLSNETMTKRLEPVMINIKIIGTGGAVSVRSAPLIPVTVIPPQNRLVENAPIIEETVVASVSIDHPVVLPLPQPIPTPTLAPPPEIDYTNAIVAMFDKTPVMIVQIEPPINHVVAVTVASSVTPMLHATLPPRFLAASIGNPNIPRTVTQTKPETTVEIGDIATPTPATPLTVTFTPTPRPTPAPTEAASPTPQPTETPTELPTISPLYSVIDTPIPAMP